VNLNQGTDRVAAHRAIDKIVEARPNSRPSEKFDERTPVVIDIIGTDTSPSESIPALFIFRSVIAASTATVRRSTDVA